MAEVINLRRAKKALARAKSRAQGTENAAKSGRSKVERQAGEAARDKATRHLDGHRIDDGTETGDAGEDGA